MSPIDFYKVRIEYTDNVYGNKHFDNYAVSVDSFQSFTDSVLDEFGSDCLVSIIGKFSFPVDRFFYRMI